MKAADALARGCTARRQNHKRVRSREDFFVVCLPQPFGPESIAAIAAMSFIGSGSFGNQLVRNF